MRYKWKRKRETNNIRENEKADKNIYGMVSATPENFDEKREGKEQQINCACKH